MFPDFEYLSVKLSGGEADSLRAYDLFVAADCTGNVAAFKQNRKVLLTEGFQSLEGLVFFNVNTAFHNTDFQWFIFPDIQKLPDLFWNDDTSQIIGPSDMSIFS